MAEKRYFWLKMVFLGFSVHTMALIYIRWMFLVASFFSDRQIFTPKITIFVQNIYFFGFFFSKLHFFFLWKWNLSFGGDPLNGSQILKRFSQKFSKKFFGDFSLKFLGFSSSLIFGPLEKYKNWVGEAYRWDCLLPFYVFPFPALSQGQNLTVPPPEKSTRWLINESE